MSAAEDAVRILWLAPYFPAPTFGGGTRVFNLIKALAASCEIDLIAMDEGADQAALRELRALCRTVEILPRPTASPRRKRLLQLRSILSRRSAQYWMLHSAKVQQRIDRAAQKQQYSAVILEHSFLGCYTLPAGVPVVLDQHNVESEILRRASEHERSIVRRAYNRLEFWKYRAEEQRIGRVAGVVVATSDIDRDTMLAWPGLLRCDVVPNGVDTTYFAPVEREDEGEKPANVLFVGSMHYAPNSEAAVYFVDSIWPHVCNQVPGATLTIVGGSPPPEVRRLGERSSIAVFGYVPDVRPYLRDAHVVIAPLHIGGGTRLKILEAMAMGRPVVSTCVGCEGLSVQDGRHLLVADEPEEFAARVATLLRDPHRRDELGRQGRHLVEESYNWWALGLQLRDTLRDLLSSEVPGSDHDVARTAVPETVV